MTLRQELDQQIAEEAMFAVKDLEAAREAFLLEQEKENPSPQVKFNYAWVLTKSSNRNDRYRGIELMEDLVDEGYSPGDCLYFIALAYYALGDYSQSRQYCERLLRRDPANGKALALHDVIKEAASKEGPIGLALAATGAVVLAVGIKMLIKMNRGY